MFRCRQIFDKLFRWIGVLLRFRVEVRECENARAETKEERPKGSAHDDEWKVTGHAACLRVKNEIGNIKISLCLRNRAASVHPDTQKPPWEVICESGYTFRESRNSAGDR